MRTCSSNIRVGVIGLGIMGAAMARNLVKCGFPVCAYNRTRAKMDALVNDGALSTSSPKDLAAQSDVIVICVTNPQALTSVLEGADGIFATPGAGKTIIQSSTIDISSTVAACDGAKRAGYRFLDAPVTGSKKQVEAAELIYEVGGESETLAYVKPVLMAMGKHIVHAGPVGAGTALKLCMNLIVAHMTTGLCEAVALARVLEIDSRDIFDVIEHSPALKCGYYAIKKEPLLGRDYSPAFSLANMLKDVRFMNEEAAKKNLSLPVTKAIENLMGLADSKGLKNEDLSVIAEILVSGK